MSWFLFFVLAETGFHKPARSATFTLLPTCAVCQSEIQVKLYKRSGGAPWWRSYVTDHVSSSAIRWSCRKVREAEVALGCRQERSYTVGTGRSFIWTNNGISGPGNHTESETRTISSDVSFLPTQTIVVTSLSSAT